jgi:hypothetical protein
LFVACFVAHAHSGHPAVSVVDPRDLVTEQQIVAALLDHVAAALPHLPGAEARVLKAVDERLDHCPTPAGDQGSTDGAAE